MKHTINGKEVNIEWEQGDLIDNHGSGCRDYQVTGEDEEGNKYWGDGNYQDDELIDVTEIEQES